MAPPPVELIVFDSAAYRALLEETFALVKSLFEREQRVDTSQWLSNAQAQQLLKVSRRTLQTWRDAGLLSFSQIGNKIYYSRPEIDRLLLNHAHKSFAK
ncbi:helix-turn-helix domain-containing protein [Hymenobacter sp. BT683]|uniref:Helix-turn-helix domain-containing protein n=1 Tax=Hymenobacter jeongseonensis TaxID=2791027 RepID=A0ABS0IMD3_9BACT|nr:helix-turn-helix domain-containing protein [Hymenobacter jeongseonensis]MBF9239534.1 helix-turn-helix domain-containing protein [Hymenobacter jeongseonensis]